jgi:hypothetical protein
LEGEKREGKKKGEGSCDARIDVINNGNDV